ncbi:hypothetical protein ABZ357_38790, partial [Streptomyces sp. NPDC005917]
MNTCVDVRAGRQDTGTPHEVSPREVSFSTVDPEQARAVLGETYYANFMDRLERDQAFSAAFDVVRLGPLTVGELGFGADVRLRFGDPGAHQIDIPVSGGLQWHQGGLDPVLTGPGSAA